MILKKVVIINKYQDMKKIILLTFVFICGFSVSSQELSPDRTFIHHFYNAEAYMYEGNYDEALRLLFKMDELDPENPNTWYKIGFCYLQTRISKPQAVHYLKKAVEHVNPNYKEDNHRERSTPMVSYLYLGEAYRLNYEFELSLSAFYMLLEKIDVNDRSNRNLVQEIERAIEVTNNAIFFTNNPVNAELRNMGPAINTEYTEHSPTVDMNETMLVFTSRRPRPEQEQINQDEDIFISRKVNNVWQKPERLPYPINTDDHNESVVGLSLDGTMMFFFRSDFDHTGNLFVTNSYDGINWTEPELLVGDINTQYKETHATMSPDGNALFFTSNRSGGLGGLDIYVTRRLPDGTWSEPKNLGDVINTPYNEDSPFIHPDGVTMFFSSEGHKSMGGYDVFYTTMDEAGNFTEPINLGFPINTPDDDVSYITNFNGRRGYIATVKDEGFGDLDIYEIVQDGIYKNNLIAYDGTVTDINNRVPEDVTVSVKDIHTHRPYGVYRPRKTDGEYVLILFPDRSYHITYEAPGHLTRFREITPTNEDFINFSQNFVANEIDPVLLESYLMHDYVFFDPDFVSLDPPAEEVLNKVIEKAEFWADEVENMIISINMPLIGVDTSKNIPRFNAISKYLMEYDIEAKDIYADGKYPAGYANVYALDIRERVIPFAELEMPIAAAEDVVYADTIYIENVLFAFDRSEIRRKYRENLDKLAEYLNLNPGARIEIGGHTDWIGHHEYNYLLSYRRAKAVKDYLVAKGNNPENIIMTKFGESNPLAPNVTPEGRDNPEGRRINRRAEITVLNQGTTSYLRVYPLVPEGKAAPEIKTVEEETVVEKTAEVKTTEVKYTIQIFALRVKKPVDQFADLVGVKLHVSDDGWFRYYVGEFSTRREAVQAMRNLQEMGYEPFIRELSYFEK